MPLRMRLPVEHGAHAAAALRIQLRIRRRRFIRREAVRNQVGNGHLPALHVLQEELPLTRSRPRRVLRRQMIVVRADEMQLPRQHIRREMLFGGVRAIAEQYHLAVPARQRERQRQNRVMPRCIVNHIRKLTVGIFQDGILRIGNASAKTGSRTVRERDVQPRLNLVYHQDRSETHHLQVLRHKLPDGSAADNHGGFSHDMFGLTHRGLRNRCHRTPYGIVAGYIFGNLDDSGFAAGKVQVTPVGRGTENPVPSLKFSTSLPTLITRPTLL